MTKPELKPCDVCSLVDNDSTPKLVLFCGMCRAWMCDFCRRDPLRRAKAFAIRAKRAVTGSANPPSAPPSIPPTAASA